MNLSEAKLERKVNEKHTRKEREANENKRENDSVFKYLLLFSVLRVNIFVSFFIVVLSFYYKSQQKKYFCHIL